MDNLPQNEVAWIKFLSPGLCDVMGQIWSPMVKTFKTVICSLKFGRVTENDLSCGYFQLPKVD